MDDGTDRRGLLRCMAWVGTGVLWTVVGGVPRSLPIERAEAADLDGLLFAQISDGQALIDSGLKANEQVVVDGQYKLQPGTRVTLLTGHAAEEAKAQSAEQAPIP